MTSHAPAWERQPYLRELNTEIVACGEGPGGAWAILADTVLYPEGGGQPSDHGWIGEVEVQAVHRAPEGIVHHLAAPVAPGPTVVRLDWPRRFDHMQQHTAQHLLTALAQDRFAWPTTAFHLGERTSDIELDVPAISQHQLRDLEEAANAEIRSGRPVRRHWVKPEEMATLPVRTRGLPSGHRGDVRLIEIERLDLNTCGGTHVASLCELESVVLVGTEPMRGGTRVYFVAGRRVRALLAEHLELAAQLRTVLGAPNNELGAVAQAKLEALRQAERATRRASEQWAATLGELLASQSQPFVDTHLENQDMPFLQRVARRFTEVAPSGVVLLTSDTPAGGLFCLAAGHAASVDLREAAQAFTTAVGGRAGGSGRVFQGKVPSFHRRAAAIAAVRALLSG